MIKYSRGIEMKKFFIIVLAVFFTFAVKVYAQNDEISLSMHVNEDVKSGKAFNIYLSAESSVEIGACRISISYDKNMLELKNISIEEKSKDDILYYNDNGGQADIIYMPENIQDIAIRFKPTGSYKKYEFEAFIYEACDKDGDYLVSDMKYNFALDVTEDDVSFESSIAEKSSFSEKVIISEKSTVSTDVSKNISQQSEEMSEPKKQHDVYYEEKTYSQTDFFVFAGIVLLFVSGLIFVYKRGFKDGKNTERKIDKPK